MLQCQCVEFLYLPVTWSWSLNSLSPSANIPLHIQHLLLIASFIFYFHDIIFIKVFFYHQFIIIILIKNRFNKLTDCIFPSVLPSIIVLIKNRFNKLIDCSFPSAKNNWFAKSTVYTHNFICTTARNMCLIFFGKKGITNLIFK